MDPAGMGMVDDLSRCLASWNAGRFSEAADRFEDLWAGEVGERRDCLRGLIHAAMGLHYAAAGDADAAGSKLATAAQLLAPFPADFLGLDLDALRGGVGMVRARLGATTRATPADFPRLCARPAGPGDESG